MGELIMRTLLKSLNGTALGLILGAIPAPLLAQIAYGVNNDGLLFRFDISTPSVVTEIAEIGFLPAAIDFRPSSQTLYAINIGPTTTQLFTVDLGSAVPTAVGAAFPTAGVGYDLGTAAAPQTFGFDFNPTTLQGDNSMRIRLVSSGTRANLRLNSSTGQIAAVDTLLSGSGVDAAAYARNIANSGGTTTLYDLNYVNDELTIQNPPNGGALNTVGPFGVTINALANTSFDIATDPISLLDSGYAVLQRPDAPLGGPLGSYLVYDVNLATGQISNGALVGPAQNPYDFTGGFAVMPVPEVGTWSGAGLVLGAALGMRCFRRAPKK
jgi:hypothetical protein